MDIEKLIERLSKYSEPVIAYKLDADFAASITDAISELRGKCDGCSVPATTAEMIRDLNDAPKLRAENEKLREKIEDARLEGYAKGLGEMSEENEKLRAELERMKGIMRYNGIMVIPPKYPGGRSEWNIPKPRGQKED